MRNRGQSAFFPVDSAAWVITRQLLRHTFASSEPRFELTPALLLAAAAFNLKLLGAEMELLTEAHQKDFDKYFVRFKEALGGEPWRRVVSEVKKHIKGNPFLDGYLRQRYSIPFALQSLSESWDKHGRVLFRIDGSVALYETSVLVVQFGQLDAVLDSKQAAGLAQRIKGGLKNPADMRALFFEMQLLTHFARRGFTVSLPAATQETSVDGLVSKDGITYEIECKSISGDKGRQVHRRDALEIHHLLHKAISPLLASLQGGLLVRITFDGMAPRAYNDRLSLVKSVKDLIICGEQRHRSASYVVAVTPFSLQNSPLENDPTQAVLAEFLEQRGIINREAMVIGRRGHNAFVVSLESLVQDRLLEETLAVAKHAARRQLSGERPGLLCIKFEDLSAEQMAIVGTENGDPTALRLCADKFLSSSSAKKVSLLGFFADGDLTRRQDGAVTRIGANYYFVNEGNEFSSVISDASLFS